MPHIYFKLKLRDYETKCIKVCVAIDSNIYNEFLLI